MNNINQRLTNIDEIPEITKNAFLSIIALSDRSLLSYLYNRSYEIYAVVKNSLKAEYFKGNKK